MTNALTRAYELGAPYVSSTVRILVMKPSGSEYHVLRPYKPAEFPYIPSAYDDSQSTKIIIEPNTGAGVQTIYYKHRDKFQFKVGAGLTIR
jgi:hypothetical protein